jgi:hypothetical protein
VEKRILPIAGISSFSSKYFRLVLLHQRVA